MKKLIIPSILLFCFIVFSSALTAQIRVAVLPFENADGKMDYNVWSYKLQDSLAKSLQERDTKEEFYRVVPIDSIEALLAEMNIDPANPQYASDMWKVVEKLNCQRVITGNFNVQGGKFLLNAYIYIPEMKLADPRYQVKDVFKDMDKFYEAVPIMCRKLCPGLKEPN
jgi:TolB-like protein